MKRSLRERAELDCQACLPTDKSYKSFFIIKADPPNLVKGSANSTVNDLEKVYAQKHLPVRKHHKSVAKLVRLYESWRVLHKSKGRNGAHCANELAFQQTLEEVFDIRKQSSVNVLVNDPDPGPTQTKRHWALHYG